MLSLARARLRRTHNREKTGLDIFWLRDESLEESDNLPDPDFLAQEIVEALETALEQFREIAADIGYFAPGNIGIALMGFESTRRHV